MKRHDLRIGETIATVVAEVEFIPIAERAVREAREDLIEYISSNPSFKDSLSPIGLSRGAPRIVRWMSESSEKVNVGPMAAVAGAIARYATESMIEFGASHVLFDNGGDIAMYLDSPAIVGIYAGGTCIKNLGFYIDVVGEVLGLCTSSATIGHSLSFGITDASIVYSADVVLADAAATALGNSIFAKDGMHIESGLKNLKHDEIKGAMVICDDQIGCSGELPRLVKSNVEYDLISKG